MLSSIYHLASSATTRRLRKINAVSWILDSCPRNAKMMRFGEANNIVARPVTTEILATMVLIVVVLMNQVKK